MHNALPCCVTPDYVHYDLWKFIIDMHGTRMLRGSTQRQVAQGVIDHILSQRLEVGDRIMAQRLARQLGVSRTPVRAALSHLVTEGLLEQRHGQGFFLRQVVNNAGEAAAASVQSGADLHDRILTDILLGSLGKTVSQSALMRRYDVSRGTLTSTLRRMAREGFADPAPGHGWTFVQFSGAVIRNGYRLRLMIEPAIILAEGYRIDEAALGQILDDHDQMLQVLGPETPWRALFTLDCRFHEIVAAGGGNELAVEIIEKQNRIRRLCEYLGYARLDRVRGSLEEHKSILKSLLEGDREWAAAQLRRHLQTSLRQSLTYYDEDIEDFRSGRRVFSLSGVR
jgi:DNA-binding GntR family transcriptional regulator